MSHHNDFSLEGKTALVAGASRGIGLAIARSLAEAGARTTLAARTLSTLEKQAAALRNEGHEAAALPLDFTNFDSIQAVAESASGVDILVNVAGTNIRRR